MSEANKRKRNTYRNVLLWRIALNAKNESGIAVFAAVLIGLLSILAMGGLYFALTRGLGSSETIKTYSSARDAAQAGVKLGVKAVKAYKPSPRVELGSCLYRKIDTNNSYWCKVDESSGNYICQNAEGVEDDIPEQGSSSNFANNFKPIVTGFKLYEDNRVSTDTLEVCIPAVSDSSGYEVGSTGSKNRTFFYTITSKTDSPQNVTSVIEALYFKRD
ncbi:MAG: hypothetical protein QXP38_08195 [Nitrososphaerota archaeon]